MFQRCYDKKIHELHPTYNDCEVHEFFQCFQNFGVWYDENYYEIENEKMNLDKDILKKGNKIYSTETCIFVPQKINLLFNKCKNARSNCVIGVAKRDKCKKYISSLRKYNKRIHLGHFNTEEEAFQVYKTAKEAYIKEVAEEYKSKIPQKLYDAMYAYKVEITD